MTDAFISHAEADEPVANEIARGLEAAGYTTWLYKTHGIPGVSYLEQTGDAVESARAFLLLISASSLGSKQVDSEVVRAHECGKPFFPVLLGLTHAAFQQRRPAWRQAVGSATSIQVPPAGAASILPRLLLGLKALDDGRNSLPLTHHPVHDAPPIRPDDPVRHEDLKAPLKAARQQLANKEQVWVYRRDKVKWPHRRILLIAASVAAVAITAQAVFQYSLFRAKQPAHPQVFSNVLDQAKEYYTWGHFDEVIRLLNAYVEEPGTDTPDLLAAYRYIGLAYVALNKELEAEQAIRELLALVPSYEPDPENDRPVYVELVREVKLECDPSYLPQGTEHLRKGD